MNEDEVKRLLEGRLREEGFTNIRVRYAKEHGSDIETNFPYTRTPMVVEVKGETAAPDVDAATALFQLIRRMDNPQAVYALAFPDTPTYRRLIERIPTYVRRRLCLHSLFVSPEAITYLPPHQVHPHRLEASESWSGCRRLWRSHDGRPA